MPRFAEYLPLSIGEPARTVDIESGMQPATQFPTPLRPVPLRQDEADFDRWLRVELNRMHSDVLQEPVPEQLLRILGGQDQRRP